MAAGDIWMDNSDADDNPNASDDDDDSKWITIKIKKFILLLIFLHFLSFFLWQL